MSNEIPDEPVDWSKISNQLNRAFMQYSTNSIDRKELQRKREQERIAFQLLMEIEAADEIVRWMPSFPEAEEVLDRISKKK